MTEVSVQVVVPDARRTAVEAAIAVLTPNYTAGFAIPVCAIAEGVTWQTPATHWYTNGASVDSSVTNIWQDAATGTLPEDLYIPEESGLTAQDILDAMAGIPVWTGVNITDFNAWADANLAGEGLMRIPPNPDP